MSRVPPVYMHSQGRDCLWAALVNGVELLLGRASAKRLYNILVREDIAYLSLGSMSLRLRNLKMGVEIRRVKGPYSLTGIWSATKGNFMVHLTRGCADDLVVVVDAGTKMIMDSAVKQPLRLTVESLGLCVGKGAVKLMVKYASNSSKRNRNE